MDAEIKARWVEALRSGEYEQIQRRLRHGASNQMCCLGVLCEIIDPSKWSPSGIYHGSTVMLPNGIREAVGFPVSICDDGLISDPAHHLADMNDDGASFAAIADWIETNL